MKIVYCLNSIRCLGGIQNVTIHKMNALAEVPGNEVYVIVTDHWSYHLQVHPLSPKVHFIKLNVNYYEQQRVSRFTYLRKQLRHFVDLQKTVSRIQPDILISVGQCEKYMIPLLWTRAVKIREIHFNSHYRNFRYPKHLAKLINFLDYRVFSWGYAKIVLLTQEDKEFYFPHNDKVVFIHNPLTFSEQTPEGDAPREKVVLCVGRLEKVKDFSSMIRVWSLVQQRVQGWKLRILGEGPDRKQLEQLAEQLHVSDSVEMPGYSDQVHHEMQRASLLTVTSVSEGFALVLPEAMSCGVPVVSYDFQFGPKDLISEGVDGYIVHQRNEQQMADRLVELMLDEEKRHRMSVAAYEKAKLFSMDRIIQRWMELFRRELKKK